MPAQPSPRGTYLKIADLVQAQVDANPDMTELPAVADVGSEYGVSRGLVLRAFNVLKHQGVAGPAPGGRWRIIREDQPVDRRPLHERLAEVITKDDLKVGSVFPSSSALCARFNVSRPTIAKALSKLEASGLLNASVQGKPRTVRALPDPNVEA